MKQREKAGAWFDKSLTANLDYRAGGNPGGKPGGNPDRKSVKYFSRMLLLLIIILFLS